MDRIFRDSSVIVKHCMDGPDHYDEEFYKTD